MMISISQTKVVNYEGRRRMQRLGVLAVIAGALLAAGSPAIAHHAVNAQFDAAKEVGMTGVLKEFDNRAPHAYWVFVDPKTMQEWRFESVSPATLRRAGIRLKEDIVVGNKYDFYYAPARDGSHTGLLRALMINTRRRDLMGDYIAPDKEKE